MVDTVPALPVTGASAAIRALETHTARPASTAAPSSVSNEHVPELFGRRGLVRLPYPAPEPPEIAARGLPRGRSYLVDRTGMRIPSAAPITLARIGSGEPHAMPLAAESAGVAPHAVAQHTSASTLDLSTPLDMQLTSLIYGTSSEQQIRAYTERLAEDCFDASVKKLHYLIPVESAKDICEDMAMDGYPTLGINCDVAARTARDLFTAGRAEWVTSAAEGAFEVVHAWTNVYEARQEVDYLTLREKVESFLADKADEVLKRHLRACAEREKNASDNE